MTLSAGLTEKYGGPVPRYTSYPTAPHFHGGVGAGTYAGWLAALDPSMGPLSLYLHVPFCREMCAYCGCHTKITRRHAPVAGYVETLIAEIALVARHLPGRFAVSQIHFGGGTPNMLAPDEFTRVMAALRGAFDLVPGAETAVEIDPRVLTGRMADAMAAAGVTRASLGVQDFNDDVQQTIGRVQPLAVVDCALGLLRRAGIHAINLDLMYGLPLQTVGKVRRTADIAAALGAQRIALFGYAHVPWMKAHQKLLDGYPRADGAERLAQAEAAAETLAGHGYRRVGLDHFALRDDPLCRAQGSGRLMRNFQGYTADDAPALIGFGASAIGTLPQGFVQNLPDARGYARAVAEGRLPIAKGLELTADDRVRAAIIGRLMCDLTVDLSDFGGALAFRPELARLALLAADGLAVLDGPRLTVPEQARPLVRVVAAVFDRYLDAGQGRHSRAV